MSQYFHVTTARNMETIRREGLLTSKAQTKEPAVWLCTMSRVPWAVLHVQKRHAVPLDEVVVLYVHAIPQALQRARRGLWKHFADLPLDRVGPETLAMDWAASPLQ